MLPGGLRLLQAPWLRRALVFARRGVACFAEQSRLRRHGRMEPEIGAWSTREKRERGACKTNTAEIPCSSNFASFLHALFEARHLFSVGLPSGRLPTSVLGAHGHKPARRRPSRRPRQAAGAATGRGRSAGASLPWRLPRGPLRPGYQGPLALRVSQGGHASTTPLRRSTCAGVADGTSDPLKNLQSAG